jgi:hypothetical protein
MIRSEALSTVITAPTTAALWGLRADLLEAGTPPDAPALVVVGEFHSFLDRFATATSSHDLSHLASKLDMAALGGVLAEQLFEQPDAKDLAKRVLTGSISEGLMVLASRQYVHVHEGELEALLRDTAWRLFELLWSWTESANPELDSSERRKLIEQLTAPISNPKLGIDPRAVLVGRLFQVLVLGHLTDG